MFIYIFFIVFGLQSCAGVIYHLNDTEYDRMPPIYELDNYERCMVAENGTYCIAKLELYSDTPNELMALIKEYSEHTFKHYNHSIVERGICVSKRCQKLIKGRSLIKEEDLKTILVECINQTVWEKYLLKTKVFEYHCDKHNEERRNDIYDYLFIYLVYGLILLNIAGTVCDSIVRRQNLEKNNHNGWKHYLMCFSITQNWKGLVSSEPTDPRLLKIKGLHCVKCIVMYLFITGHAFYNFHLYTENTHKFEKYYEYFWYKLVFNGMVSVQMLFCISGFLLAYNMLIESEKRKITWKTVPQVIMLRLFRLTPSNALYVLFSATLLRHWGTGPIWKMKIEQKIAGDCRRYWWAHLIFINNYIPDDVFCVVQNWQLAADVQLFVFGLCIFVAMKSHQRAIAFSSLILFGMGMIAANIWWYDLNPFLMLSPETYRTFGLSNYSIRKFAHMNIPGFMIGMLAGDTLYNLQKSNVNLSKYKSVFNAMCHAVIPTIVIIFFTGSFFYEDHVPAPMIIRMVYGMTLVPVVALITAFMIFAIIYRLSDFWAKFVEWDGWVIPGRLTYCVSLIHSFFIINLLGSRTQLLYVSSLNHAVMYLGVGVLSYVFAIPYCIMVEAPFNKLIKTILMRNVQKLNKEE